MVVHQFEPNLEAGTQEGTSTELAPLNRIRVETALSRFPIHRLAKRGAVRIDMMRLTEAGQTDYQWKVSFNAEHGQPGPLAYKLDTLIINRVIDEAKRPLPEVIRLGSLSDICRKMDMSDSGVNRAHVKSALLQNASAFIQGMIECRDRSGKASYVEIADSRYGLVFTGKRLPDGTLADAVYIQLHPWFRDLQNQVELRPLDYDYLRALPEAAQRLYELLSFPMYGALSNDRSRAKLLYSDFCLFAPVTRYFEYDPVKKQMGKIHKWHRESGYIVKVQFIETQDAEGRPDWEMLYVPGPKALAEFQTFSRRGAGKRISTSSPSADTPAPPPVQTTLDLADADAGLLAELTGRGIIEKKACELLAAAKPGQEILDQLEYTRFDHRQGSARQVSQSARFLHSQH